MKCKSFMISLAILLGNSLISFASTASPTPFDWAFVRLDYARNEKVSQLKHFCEVIHRKASKAGRDDVMINFFDVNEKYCRMVRENKVPKRFVEKTAEFRNAFKNYYVQNYLAFYDILFVDRSGNICYSIRKELDSRQNLLDDDFSETPLGQCLRSAPGEEKFVDFHHYAASDEPASFFVEPVYKADKHLGWIVLQFAINKINSLFAGAEQLGQNGEVFVVDQQGRMLTESSFEGEPTILKKHLDNANIKVKFSEGKGHRTVIDYRGFRALTSFEVVEFLGTKWLVVAKVDESQITTEHFIQHRKYYGEKIIKHIAGLPPAGDDKKPSHPSRDRKIIRVDMDEFVKANHGELLKTIGVSTCTAIIATYPGKFGYLAHISPLDRIYGSGTTNLLGHITLKIKTYDIYKYERRRVRFVIVAKHFDSLMNAVNKLVDEGFLLSQISFLYHPQARCANVTYDYSEDNVCVQWLFDHKSLCSHMHHAGAAHNLDDIIKNYLGG